MNFSTRIGTEPRHAPGRRAAAIGWRRPITLAGTVLCSLLLAAAPLRAQCIVDVQGADDQPGQKDLSQVCIVGACTGGTEATWSFDDTSWSGNNTGDACALFDTNGDGNVERAVCVTIVAPAVMQAGNPKCYTCGNTRPDRCTNSVLVACTSTCSVSVVANDPFALDPNHLGNKCAGPNCRTNDAVTDCCLAPGDAGSGGVLIDVCSYPSQQPNSDPSDCVVNRQCSKNDPNDPACDDRNACTVDSCDTTFGVCRHVAGNAGDLCRAPAGACDAAEYCTGSSISCPADQFTTGGVCRNASDLCDVAESCDGTSADCPADGVKPSGTVCRTSTGVCDVAEVCDGTSKSCPNDGSQPSSTPCNDGNACTVGDHCDGAGHCVGGSAKNCNDNNVCTDDSCDPDSGCVNTPNEASCDDNNACTDPDRCSGGSCVGGPEPDCSDGNVCTDDSCVPATGCKHTNNSEPCSDDNACTDGDQCSGGSCVPGGPTDCNDNNACTNDFCASATGCFTQPIADCCNFDNECGDSNACTINERCVDHKCVSDQRNCNDNNVCTDDSCDPDSGCVNTPNEDPCDDDNACTDPDTCSGGECVGGPAPDCGDGNVCTDDSCDPDSGCVNTDNTKPCDDRNACTTDDRCSGGGCVGGPPPDCSDDNPCTDEGCDPATGCTKTNNTDPCSDGNPCTLDDTCEDGGCVPGNVKDCDDGNLCTDDTCNPQTGSCEGAFNSEPCSDGNVCTDNDHCFQGACQPGGEKDCNDGNFCTDDFCTPATDCQHTGRPDCCNEDDECVDTSHCTVNERCVDHACTSDPRDCSDNDQCTIDTCSNQGGGFLCENTSCLEIEGQPCPDPSCFPPSCGDGTVDSSIGETCDPPGSPTEWPGVLCREDCTYCGDEVVQAEDGETCDDGNKTQGCIKNDSFPIDACQNNCTPHICRDPTKAVLNAYIDKFTFHGRLSTNGTVDFASENFAIELRTPSGRVLYRTSVPAGALLSVSGTSAGPFKYGNKLAKLNGGLAKVKVKPQGDVYRVTAQGYGNLLGVRTDMMTHVHAGKNEWTVLGAWEKRSPKLWRFRPAVSGD